MESRNKSENIKDNLIFKIETEDTDKILNKRIKIIKRAYASLRRSAWEKLKGKLGEC
ncbi:MAG: hypothetical protein Q8P53_02390 [Candidatus Shapirobacteria bacterium]|nr:hypothetical protein [Candidatus Shapirobacteria bacterium]